MSTQTHQAHGTSMGKYMVGFILSVILTLVAFFAVMLHWIDGWSISAKVLFLLGLAVIQMTVQIVFFLHLNEGPDAKWNIGTMWIAIVCVFIIIAGTWKTMQHLNYNMMGGSGRVIRSDVIYHPTASQPSASTEEDAGAATESPEVVKEEENAVPEIRQNTADEHSAVSPDE